MTAITCAWCGAVSEKRTGEINRQLRKGKTTFFCNNVCSGYYAGATREDRVMEVTQCCPQCGVQFVTETGKLNKTFCSRKCASIGSVSEARRKAGRNLGAVYCSKDASGVVKLMKSREALKYSLLRAYLEGKGEEYEFEFVLGNSVFDLAMPARRLLVEFDGPDHKNWKQQAIDAKRDSQAAVAGWKVARIEVEPRAVIPHALLAEVLEGAR